MRPKTEQRVVRTAGLALALAVGAAYANSLFTPFVFDDIPSITDNPTIRRLWPIGRLLAPPPDGGLTIGGRPLVNLSLALNHAISGTGVWSYHALNLAIHLLAALALFGIVRRTLGDRPDATFAGFLVALLWALHPLQTEAVTYVMQRAESLMGLFYLLTLYCFIRGAEGHESGQPSFAEPSAGEKAARCASFFWFGLSWLACLFGMATKEVMATAPLIVLLYDRTFVAGTFREAWRMHRRLYLALAATWLLVGYLALGTNGRGGTAGFAAGVPWWTYALTQCRAIVLYLRLSVWPRPLVFDYGTGLVRQVGGIGPQVVVVALLAAATGAALWRRPVAGFLGAWFLLILAPSSSVIPVATQTIAEHRMYLPLAALAVLFVLGLLAAFGRRGLVAAAALAAALGGLTAQRNRDYRTEVALWTDTVGKVPGNPRAHYNLAVALDRARSVPEALRHYQEAIRLKPDYVEARNNLANDLQRVGRLPEALAQFGEAVRLRPAEAEARYNLGNALYASGRAAAAAESYREAIRLRPGYAEAHTNLGVALFALGRTEEAIAEYGAAVRLDPMYPAAQYDWGNALAETGRGPQAIGHYEAALRLDPRHDGAQANLGNALAATGQLAAAIGHYEAALALRPDNPRVRYNLGNALLASGRAAEAAEQYGAALRLQPDFAAARAALDRLRGAAPGTGAL